MALRRAIGVVKDQTSIGLAKVSSSDSLADLDVAIVRATSHEEFPSEERHIREILSLTCYSRAYIRSCVNTIARRLSKTKTWVVALKTLMLIQRLLLDGDPAYEQEIFFTTRRGTRLLNLTDFRDSSRSNSWDYSAFVRTYALYLDEMLEYRMQGKRKKHHSCAYSCEDEEEQSHDITAWNTPIRELTVTQIMSRMHHLQQLLERFLATKPTGVARYHRLILVALYPAVNESFQVYYETTDVLSLLIDRFMELDIPDCVKVHGIFCRISKQFDELDLYYSWAKETGIARCSEYPEVERITPKKLELMDEFIRDKAANEQSKLAGMIQDEVESPPPEEEEEEREPEDMNSVKALPPPEKDENKETNQENKEENKEPESEEADLLHLGDDAPTSEEHADRLALALFDGAPPANPPGPNPWEVFNDQTDWETALVQSASYLPNQKATLGGGFDMMLLDGMYTQQATNVALAANNVGGTGSASSVALGSVGNPQLLALPAPPTSSPFMGPGNVDPFAPSLGVPPPPYVQMSEIEKKQRLLLQEQLMWQQYQRNGMQGPAALSKMQAGPPNMGGYNNGYSYGYGF